jgi:hypothetical protein
VCFGGLSGSTTFFPHYLIKWHGNECGNTKVMRISRQPTPVTVKIDQKQLENVKCFKYVGSLLTDDGRCACEIKSRIAMAKAEFNKKKSFYQQLAKEHEGMLLQS